MDYLNEIKDEIKGLGFDIIGKDFERPWGGFLVIKESNSQEFANQFFDGIDIETEIDSIDLDADPDDTGDDVTVYGACCNAVEGNPQYLDCNEFVTKQECDDMIKFYAELPADGSWDTVEYICKPVGSTSI